MSERARRHPEPHTDQDPASGWLEHEDFFSDHRDAAETREDQDRRVRTFTRQICVRLSSGQSDELGRAADLYGVAPSTMARILVRRGARAVLEHHRRYDLEQDGLD